MQILIKTRRPIVYGEFTPKDIQTMGYDPGFIFTFFQDYSFFQEIETGIFIPLLDTVNYTRDILLVPNEKLQFVQKNLTIKPI